MQTYFRFSVLTVLYCLCHIALGAESRSVEVKWTELAPLISGYRVTLELNDGSRIRGDVIAVREQGIVMDISELAKGQAYGDGLIPRSAILVLHLERSRGSWGRGIGTVLGVMGGVVLGAYGLVRTDSAGAGIPVFLGISSAAGLGGYYAGKLIDRRVTHIKIAP